MTEKKKRSSVVAVATVIGVTSIMSPVSIYAQEDVQNPKAQETAGNVTQENPMKKEQAPPITLPQGLSGNDEQKLQEIPLPDGWSWADETSVLSKDKKEYPARMTVDDLTYDYSTVNGYHPEGHYVEYNVVVETIEPNTNNAPQTNLLSLSKNQNGSAVSKNGDVLINELTFPDAVFREWVKGNLPGAQDSILTANEISSITDIDFESFANIDTIKSLQGIEYFTELVNLNCNGTAIKSLDVSKNTKLEYLSCVYNSDLTSLNVKGAKALKELFCFVTGITELDVSENLALEYLDCDYTMITKLDVSKNIALIELYCNGNDKLVSLNVKGATALTHLECKDTGITTLDISENKALTDVYCQRTNIISLDVSNNLSLEDLYCNETGITSLDVSKNTFLAELSCLNTPLTWLNIGDNLNLLRFLQLPTPTISTNLITDSFNIKDVAPGIDPSKITITDNGSMDKNGNISKYDKNKPIQYTYRCGTYQNGQPVTMDVKVRIAVDINKKNFPDDVFREWIKDNLPGAQDGILAATEINSITDINLEFFANSNTIKSLQGIEYFTELINLNCYGTGIKSLDVSRNTKLVYLKCSDSINLTSLNVKGAKALKTLICSGTGITELDVSENLTLQWLNCDSTKITKLDVSKNIALTDLSCSGNDQLVSLNLKGATALTDLTCVATGITTLDISENKALMSIHCQRTNITSLDVSNNLSLWRLHCDETGITSLDVSKNTALTELGCLGTPLAWLNIGDNWNPNNYLRLPTSTISTNFIADSFNIEDVAPGIDLSKITITDNGFMDKNGNISKYDKNKPIQYTYHCGTDQNGQPITMNVSMEVFVDINKKNFPDDVFRAYVEEFSTDQDLKLSASEIDAVTELFVDDANGKADIESLKGVEFFSSLTRLECTGTKIKELDISMNPALTRVVCQSTGISKIDVSNNKELEYLNVAYTNVEKLDVSNQPKLTHLLIGATLIKSMDLSKNTNLQQFYCRESKLESINLEKNEKLTHFDCGKTNIEKLDLTNNIALIQLQVDGTKIKTLNLDKLQDLEELYVWETSIASLNLRNNKKLKVLDGVKTNYAYVDWGSAQLTTSKLTPANLAISVYADGFDLTEAFPGIDINKVSIISNGTKDGNFIRKYQFDQPIVYEYACGQTNGVDTKLQVTLQLTKKMKASTIEIDKTFNQLTYTGKAMNHPTYQSTGSDGEVTFAYEVLEDNQWVSVTNVPINAGTYRVKAQLAGNDVYNGAESKWQEFEIMQATNAWNKGLTMNGWMFGTQESDPIAEAKFGEVTFVYSGTKDFANVINKPKDAGIYYVKAYVEGTENYQSLSSKALMFEISKAEDIIHITDDLNKDYDGKAVIKHPMISHKGTGEVTYQWQRKEGKHYVNMRSDELPTDVGEYQVIAEITESKNYKSATSLTYQFTITQATNVWVDEPALFDWTYGEKGNMPTAKAKFGDVSFSYSDAKNGTFTDTVPTNAGTWYVKTSVNGTSNYTSLEHILNFSIKPKPVGNQTQIVIPEINSDQDLENLIIKDGEKELVLGVDYDITKKQEKNTTTVTIHFKGNYTGTIVRSYAKPNEETETIQTGDVTQTRLFTTLSMISAGWIALICGKKYKKQKNSQKR